MVLLWFSSAWNGIIRDNAWSLSFLGETGLTCYLTPDCKTYLMPWNVSTWPYKRVKFLCFCSLFSRLPIHVTFCLNTYSIIKLFSFSFTFGEKFSRTEETLFFTISLPKCKPFVRTTAHTGTKPSSLHVTAQQTWHHPGKVLLPSPPPTLALTHHLPATKPFCSSKTWSSFSLYRLHISSSLFLRLSLRFQLNCQLLSELKTLI